MKIKTLYLSALSSEKLISDIYNKTHVNPGFAVQKFSRLIVEGIKRNGVEIVALSVPPITRQYEKKMLVKSKEETENEIKYVYIPWISLPIVKHLCVFIYSFFYVLWWGAKVTDSKAIICDVLCISSSMGSLLASKLCGVKSVAVVTDIYEQMIGQKSKGFNTLIKRFAGILNKKYVCFFDKYILLTKAMNELVNPKGKPYLVMEGLCDQRLQEEGFLPQYKSIPKVIMYAGGLEERYGLKMLVDAFKTIPDQDVELHLYGNGSYVAKLTVEASKDSRIKFWGVRANAEIVEAEHRATILINPRFTTEEFTKYSFPSKNMEYMVSGTPLITTKLPGMPDEYYPYVYLIENETIEGYAEAISKVLKQSDKCLLEKGRKAREFVLKKKNNVAQASEIIELINSSGYESH